MTIDWHPEVEGSDLPLYQAIAQALAEDIAAGRLPGGSRLPTHRELAEKLGIARGTVTRAYLEAERRGLVKSEVGRGTFVCDPAHPVATLLPVRSGRPELIDLSINYPIPSLDPDLAPVLGALMKSQKLGETLHYHPSQGIERHRHAGVLWARRVGVAATEDSIVVCAGAQHAITVALASLAEPGDVVACDHLTYPGFKAVAKLLRLRLHPLEMDEEGIRPDDFASLCLNRPVRALYCMPSMQNPTSACLGEERRKEIAAIAAHHGTAILEDDVHRVHVEDPPAAFHTLLPEQTYFIAATSKAIAGGLRVAYLVAPRTRTELLSQTVWATAGMVTPLTAEIAARWIEDGTAGEVVQAKSREIRERHRMVEEVLEGMTYRTRKGSFFLWLELPSPWGSSEFALEARRRGVAVTPSDAFVVGAEPPPAVRVCLGAAADRKRLRRGLEVLRDLLAGDLERSPTIV